MHNYAVGEAGVLVHNSCCGLTGVVRTPQGGVRFKGTKYLYKPKAGEKNIVSIKLQGSRYADFSEANRLAKLKKTPKGYTWHHVDNFNPQTGRATMELVKTKAHKKVGHKGSVSQYEEYHGVEYR